ncbi:YciI family protein [Catenulispora yoronensis]|uniref:YciI family protein n=1 Tax=Catenulispora yoronensis TaxID=450799 RepID=A0ABN2VMF5_9ACTN
MRYLLLIHQDPGDVPGGDSGAGSGAGPGAGPDPALAEDMGRLIEEMTKAGVLLATGGLRPAEEAVRLRLADGKVTTLDGPFTESKEVVGGYCLIEAGSLDEAVHWGSRFLGLHGADWTMEIEVRQVDQ